MSSPPEMIGDPAASSVLFKPGLYSRKTSWVELALADVPDLVAGWSPQAFAAGEVALWLSPKAETQGGRVFLPWWTNQLHRQIREAGEEVGK